MFVTDTPEKKLSRTLKKGMDFSIAMQVLKWAGLISCQNEV